MERKTHRIASPEFRWKGNSVATLLIFPPQKWPGLVSVNDAHYSLHGLTSKMHS